MRFEARSIDLCYLGARENKIFHRVDFIIDRPLTVLLGPSGSGKTSLLKLLSLKLFPSAGDLRINDLSYKSPNFDRKSFQDRILYLDNSIFAEEFLVADNLALNWKNDEEYSARLATIHQKFDRDPLLDQRFRSCSTGQRMMVLFYLARLIKPALLMVDEPSANLNDSDIEDLKKELLSFRAHSQVIVATNDQRLLDLAADFWLIADSKVKRYDCA